LFLHKTVEFPIPHVAGPECSCTLKSSSLAWCFELEVRQYVLGYLNPALITIICRLWGSEQFTSGCGVLFGGFYSILAAFGGLRAGLAGLALVSGDPDQNPRSGNLM
jgi:hypothetical protein